MKTLEELKKVLNKLADENLSSSQLETQYNFMKGNGWNDLFEEESIDLEKFKQMYEKEVEEYEKACW